MTDALAKYLQEVRGIRATGMAVKETSYYPAISNLLNAIGSSLKPRVSCVMQLSNRGAGYPDGGLFTPEQVRSVDTESPLLGQLPSRGVIEAKGPGDQIDVIVASEQVDRYLGRYGQVLVTNLREFVIVTAGEDGAAVMRERFTLATSELGFWTLARDPEAVESAQGELFTEYLRRVLLYAAPLSEPKDVAFFLASYARDARIRLEHAGTHSLRDLRVSLEEGLGIHFEGEHGERFFRSTLVQTLFYGVFSAWVLWSRLDNTRVNDKFDWRSAGWHLRVPVIQSLYEEIAKPSNLGALKLVEVLGWAGDALNRVNRESFFARFEEHHAVQYFYEPFLEAFDPQLRKELGVWYTPDEVVRYMVERVDVVLRQELRIADGLADPRVHVLDPCTGTGSYPIAVLERIAKTLRQKGDDALIGAELKRAAMERIHGFEILPAPFVVAHLQIGLVLQQHGAAFDDISERASVYLTNALTDWEDSTHQYQKVRLPHLADERDAAERVKRDEPILVVIGNPPYNAFSGVASDPEGNLVEPYKARLNTPTAQGGWGIKKFNLDDLYIRFFRIAERRITEGTGQGIVCYISNFSYLSDASFVVMRQRLLEGFDMLWFDSLNGDSRETGKRTPDGRPDPSIFSTPYNTAGIRVGTAVGLMVRKQRRDPEATVRYREFWGATKRAELLESAAGGPTSHPYVDATPSRANRFSLRPSAANEHYLDWPNLINLAAIAPSNGLMEKRGGALIDIDRDRLSKRMQMYFDQDVSWTELEELGSGLTRDAARFQAQETRRRVLKKESFSPNRIVRYAQRPFDTKWAYYSPVRPLWNEPRPLLVSQLSQSTGFLVSRAASATSDEGHPLTFTTQLSDDGLLSLHASSIPFLIASTTSRKSSVITDAGNPLGLDVKQRTLVANLSRNAYEYLRLIGIEDPQRNAETAGLVWMHALAVGYAPKYLSENGDAVHRDWPRIPLPVAEADLRASAALGARIAALLETEASVPGVTSGDILPLLRLIGRPNRLDGKPLDASSDFVVTAGWGRGGGGEPVMPGSGRLVQRAYSSPEAAAVAAWGNSLGASVDGPSPLGETTIDVFLNDRAFWCNVPSRVWSFRVGGHQAMKKWLSYREASILGRPLTLDEVRELQNMSRRIAMILLLEPELDANYHRVTEQTYSWPSPSATASPTLF